MAWIGRGDFSVRVPVTIEDEIGALAAAVNQMAVHLQRSYTELEQKAADDKAAEAKAADEKAAQAKTIESAPVAAATTAPAAAPEAAGARRGE